MDRDGRTSALKILRDMEARAGALRLDQQPYQSAPPAAEWASLVYGDWLKERPTYLATVPISLFDNPLSKSLVAAASLLSPRIAKTLRGLPVAIVSIPVMNACAVKRDGSLAIAINQRLSNLLPPANAIAWDLSQAEIRQEQGERGRHEERLQAILLAHMDERFDLAMANVCPFPTELHFRLGAAFARVQLLFVLLHEIGHVLLGHLNEEELWVSGADASKRTTYFNSSQCAEFAADQFAIQALFSSNRSVWRKLTRALELPPAPHNFHQRTFYRLICALLRWFAFLVPASRDEYYAAPRSHPHPLDRLEAIVREYECIASGSPGRRRRRTAIDPVSFDRSSGDTIPIPRAGSGG